MCCACPNRSALEAVDAQFDSAVCPEDVFGGLIGTGADRRIALRDKYHSLVRICHPDVVPAQDKDLAVRVFQRLGEWERAARKKITADTYGDRRAPYADPVPPPSPYYPTTLTLRGKSLTLTGLIGEGIFATVHAAEYETEAVGSVFVKCVRDPGDNDLLEREFAVLKTLQKPDADPRSERDFFGKQRTYVPHPITSFSLLDENRVKRNANVLSVPEGKAYTAAALRTEKFPQGIEPEHVWWIFRRLLLTAWMAHLRGYVHGAITPDHVLIYPEAHGLVLLDWTCAAEIGEEHVPAMNPAYEAFYPPETLRKEPALPSADIYMAASTAIFMLGGDPSARQIPADVPSPIAEALLDCLQPISRRRPQDAERFHSEFGALLGKRVYAEMVVP